MSRSTTDNVSEQAVREGIRAALKDRASRGATDIPVTISCEADLQQLLSLIRHVGGNSLLKGILSSGGAAITVRVMPGSFERPVAGESALAGCGCGTDRSGGAEAGTDAGRAIPHSMGGLVSEMRLQAMEPRPVALMLDSDAVVTPAAKDWLRGHKIKIHRSTS